MYLQRLLKSAFLFVALIGLTISPASASHIMGGEMAYKCLGGNDYEITLVVYRDCDGINISSTQNVDISSITCQQNLTTMLSIVDTAEVTSGCASFLSTCQGGVAPGMQVYLYRDTITLPMACTDWVFSNTQCCRNAAISNLVDPDTKSSYFEAQLDNVNGPCNSSPIYQVLQMPFVCDNVLFCLDNGTYDADGDSLVFSMQPVYDSDPFTPIPYNIGFSHTDPFPSLTGHTFDPITGNHCAIPTGIGAYVVAYKIDEYRNGTWIGSTSREVQLWVTPCPSALLDIGGVVTDTAGVPITSGDVELYEYGLNAMGSGLVASQAVTSTGNFLFPAMPNGQYIVRAFPDTNIYSNMATSYHVSTYYWDYANVISAVCDTSLDADIQLVSFNNLNGQGYLSGYLGDLGIIRSSNGTPWPGVGIILESWPQRELVSFTRTSPSGHYNFSNVPNGNYRIIVDHPGIPMSGYYTFQVGPGSLTHTGLDYAAEPLGIYPAPEVVGVEELEGVQIVIAPNPAAQGVVTLMGLEDGRTVLTVEDLMGRQVMQTQLQVNNGRAQIQLDALASGTYLIHLNNGPNGLRLIKE